MQDAEGTAVTKRVVYFVIGYIALLSALFAFQLRAEASYTGRISIGFITGAFLMVYGLLSAGVMTFYFRRVNRFEAQITGAFFALDLGIQTMLLCGAQVPFFAGRQMPVLLRVTQALAIPLAFLCLGLKPGRMKRRNFRLTAVFSAVASIALIPLSDTLGTLPYLVLCAVVLFFTAQDLMKNISNDRAFTTETLLNYAFFGLCVLMVLNAFIHLLQVFGFATGPFVFQYVYPFGAAFFLMAVTFSFSIFVLESYAKYDENAVLFHAAYEDPLTGLSNRAAWDEKMKEIDEQPESYCIISLDLDGLKGVNDTWGHEAGDRLIKGFARSLADAFTEPHFLARIGGDEFCVIMQDVSEDEVKRRLKSMDTRLAVLNRRDKEVNHSCSYGYAFRDPEKGGAHEIYLEADTKMYATKQMHKAQRKADALTKADSNETKVAQMVQDALAAMNPEEAKKQAAAEAPKTAAEAFAQANGIAQAPAAQQAGPSAAPAPAAEPTAAQKAQALRMRELRTQRSAARIAQEQKTQTQRALEQMQDAEVRNVSKEIRVKKALKVLEEAQAKQSQAPGAKKE